MSRPRPRPSLFREYFGDEPSSSASAPGRVNLIGEHTDYNDGFVLPMPIPQQTHVELRPRDDELVRVRSHDVGEGIVSYTLGAEQPTGGFIDYIQGVTRELLKRGQQLRGFDALVTSRVPVGAGLSSSAALEVSMLRALQLAYDLPLDDREIARIGQRAEVDFVGAPVGIMDQMASSLGRAGRALFIDTRSLETRDVPLPRDLELVVIASGVTHAHGTGEYRQRRSECEQAATQLGVRLLRELAESDLDRVASLPSPLDRRAKHVITENARVLRTVDALAAVDCRALEQLFADSHDSMRKDFEVSVTPIDLLVEFGRAQPGIVAARLTGGGFGGSVVMLAERGRGTVAARAIAERYMRETRLTPSVLLPEESSHAS